MGSGIMNNMSNRTLIENVIRDEVRNVMNLQQVPDEDIPTDGLEPVPNDDLPDIYAQDEESNGREFLGVNETANRISSAYNEPVTQNVPDVLKPSVSVAEGVADFTLGAGAGVNDVLAGLINLFDDENAAADFLTDGANKLRARQFKSKSDGGIMSDAGQLAGNEVAGAYIGGKAADLLGATSKALPLVSNKIKSTASSNLFKAGKKADETINTLGRQAINRGRVNSNKSGRDFAIDSRRQLQEITQPTTISSVTDIIGKVSPTAKRVIDKYYNIITSPISKNARARVYREAKSELKKLGFSEKRIDKLLTEKGLTASDVIQLGKNGINSKTKPGTINKGSVAGALLGTQGVKDD